MPARVSTWEEGERGRREEEKGGGEVKENEDGR